ncbi:hypothetical protein [Levilactobacillus enshiensis]|uniref:hypothetical protein n=1 Tax=Levilactobacillus enshiensis TaxID=2590213 RepID=UPI00117A4516|nr:hypothetical protein [Levilactobacillus enshiensis]
MNDESDIQFVINKIIYDYDHGRFKMFFHKKTTRYLEQQRLSTEQVLAVAIDQLVVSHSYRGPSAHRWLEGIIVYEFIEYIYGIDMYVKFDIGSNFTQIESFHPREKKLNVTWKHY